MSYKNLISALVFAAFGFCLSEAAKAQECDNPDFCFDFGFPSTIDNLTGSHVLCDLDSGGSNPNNTLDIGAGFGTATATFTQTGTANCTYYPDVGSSTDLGTCAFNLAMTGVTTSACTAATKSFTAGAFCQDGSLTVTGTLTCPPGSTNIMNLGIAGMTRNRHNCETVFPSGDSTGLPAGKVLDFTINTDSSTCTGPYSAISPIKERWCNSGDLLDSAVDCTPSSGPIRASTQVATSAVPFDLNVRQSVNTSLCSGGGTKDKGQANIDIYGSNAFNVNNIDVKNNANPLACEGQTLVCGKASDLNGDGFLDLPCQAVTCPIFGPALGDLPLNPDGTVTVTCTGQLKFGTAILGTDPSVKIN